MTRQAIREMKRNLSRGTNPCAPAAEKQLAREATLALLERSVRFGHRRLAVIRLSVAVQYGADIPEAYLALRR